MTFKSMKKSVETSIVAANNHYAGFGPVTAKLFANMLNLENKIRPFPIVDYKYLLVLAALLKINKISMSINKYVQRQDTLIFLNSSDKSFDYLFNVGKFNQLSLTVVKCNNSAISLCIFNKFNPFSVVLNF